MKLQSSIEFIVILTVVGVFSVFVLSQYLHFQNAQLSAYNKIENSILTSEQSNQPIVSFMNLSADLTPVIPNITYIGKPNSMEAILSYPQDYKVKSVFVELLQGNAEVFPSNYSDIQQSAFNILSFSVVPASSGTLSFSITALLSNGTNTINLTKRITSYSIFQNGSGSSSSQTTAYLSNINESYMYLLTNQTPITTLYLWNRCPILTGQQYWDLANELVQCGPNTWGFYWDNLECAYPDHGQYYCISSNPTQYSAKTPSKIPYYRYNISLNVQAGLSFFKAILSNATPSAAVLDKNDVIHGEASVNSVYGYGFMPPPYQSYIALLNQNSDRVLNLSNYTRYSNQKLSTVSLLQEYNGSWMNGSSTTVAQIIYEVGLTNKYENSLTIANNASLSGCGYSPYASNQYIVCQVENQFYYNITAILYNSSINQSVNYQGSIINLR